MTPLFEDLVLFKINPFDWVNAAPYVCAPAVVMDAPILTELLAVATKAPLIVRVWPDPVDPSVKAPVLLNVVAVPMVELLLARPRTNSKSVDAVFKATVFIEPAMVIFPV
jgi:hypothetical protein